jgi:hypothetical protein
MIMFDACLAYIGPGAGLGLMGALVSLLVSVGLALLMVLAWPMRAAFKKIKAKKGVDGGV